MEFTWQVFESEIVKSRFYYNFMKITNFLNFRLIYH